MALRVIVSYDDTANDQDALALGRLFRQTGAEVALAYVRHTQESEEAQERLEEHEAQALLERGANALGGDVKRHVVLSASTGEGLWALAEREHADIVVFGSDYRTAPGAVAPGSSAQRLLTGGPAAVAIAPADLRSQLPHQVDQVALVEDGDAAAGETARALAASLGAKAIAGDDVEGDILVLGSTSDGQDGRVTLSASIAYELETATVPVLAVPRGKSVPFVARTLAEA